MTNTLTYLALNHPDFEKRSSVEELDLTSKSLEGELDFTNLGFTNLKRLKLANNQLTKLVLENTSQITYLDISENKITELKADSLNHSALTFGQIKNNPLSNEIKKQWLLNRWEYYREVEVDYTNLLVPRITELVDSSDLNSFIENYDFSHEGNQEYHQIIGNGFTSLDEYALDLLSQQLLARCLIKQNELVDGKDLEYEQKINTLAKQFQKAGEMFTKCPLKIIQRELWKELNNEKDLSKEFQRQLGELEMILRKGDEGLNPVPDLEQIKNKISELQTIIQVQKEQLIKWEQAYNDKENARKVLSEYLQRSEEEKQEIGETKTQLENRLTQTAQELENKLENLTLAEYNEKECRKRIGELEEQIKDSSQTIRQEFTKLLEEKDTHISQLNQTIQKLKESKAVVEKELKENKLISEKPGFNWKKCGVIAIMVVFISWGIWKIKKYF